MPDSATEILRSRTHHEGNGAHQIAATSAPSPRQLRDFHCAAIASVARDAEIGVSLLPADPVGPVRVATSDVRSMRDLLQRTAWSGSGRTLSHPLWGEVLIEPGGPGYHRHPPPPIHSEGCLRRSAGGSLEPGRGRRLGAVLPGGPVLSLAGPAALAWEAVGDSVAEVASRFRCKRAGPGSGFVGLMLRGGGDSVGLVGVVDGVSGS